MKFLKIILCYKNSYFALKVVLNIEVSRSDFNSNISSKMAEDLDVEEMLEAPFKKDVSDYFVSVSFLTQFSCKIV